MVGTASKKPTRDEADDDDDEMRINPAEDGAEYVPYYLTDGERLIEAGQIKRARQGKAVQPAFTSAPNQEGEWDYSLSKAMKAIAHEAVEGIEMCTTSRTEAEGADKPYERLQFGYGPQGERDKQKHILEFKRNMHIQNETNSGWEQWPNKSLQGLPNCDRDFGKQCRAYYAAVDPGMTASMKKNSCDSMRWGCRGLAIKRGLLETGKRPEPADLEDCWRMRDYVRVKQLEVRRGYLLRAKNGLGPCTNETTDANWQAFIRHKHPELVQALDAYLAREALLAQAQAQ